MGLLYQNYEVKIKKKSCKSIQNTVSQMFVDISSNPLLTQLMTKGIIIRKDHQYQLKGTEEHLQVRCISFE